MSTKVSRNYTWKCECGQKHKLDFYAIAHVAEILVHKCDCGREHQLKNMLVTLLKPKKKASPATILSGKAGERE